jgi:metal-dependent amidase/aminoacylase/carboxypeptidase family protein
MSKSEVVITGLGIVSPYGCDVAKYYDRLAAGEIALRPTPWMPPESGSWYSSVEDFNALDWMSEQVAEGSDRFAQFASAMARDVVGPGNVVQLPHPVMGAEDFSYLLQNVPGAMMFLGGTPHDRNPQTAAPNHSNRVYFDEAAMTSGISLYATAALQHLRPA